MRKENLSEFSVISDFQKFVHIVNNKFRVSSQSPFTNISLFDRPNLEKVFEHYTYPDGSKVDIEYVIKLEKISLEIGLVKAILILTSHIDSP